MTTVNECVVNGTPYAKAPETKGCAGCVGYYDRVVCESLPDDCLSESVIWVRTGPVTVEELNTAMETHARVEFEDKAYDHYLKRKAAGELDPNAEGDGSREALFWKQPDGSYGVLMFNAAWQGFKWGRGLE